MDALHQNTYQMLDGIRRPGNDDENGDNAGFRQINKFNQLYIFGNFFRANYQ